MKLFRSQRPYIASQTTLHIERQAVWGPPRWNPSNYSRQSCLRHSAPDSMTAVSLEWLQPYVALSEARAPDWAQFSLGTSSKMTIVASGVVCAIFTIASVIPLANSCFWACVRPAHISTRTTGMIPSVREYGAHLNLVSRLCLVNPFARNS